MAIERDSVVYVALNRITTAAPSDAHQVGGHEFLGWQFWGSDGAAAQVDLSNISIELQGRIVERNNVNKVGATFLTGPWVKIGTTQVGVAGGIIRDVIPLAVTEVRIVVNDLTLGSAADLCVLLRFS